MPEIRSWTSWIIIFGGIIAAFILLVFQLGIPLKLDQMIILLTFVLGTTAILIFFLLFKNKPKELDIFGAGEKVIGLWKKHFDEILTWKEPPEKASTKTYEDNNNSYFAYLFESEAHANVVVVWNQNKSEVADWDTDPSAERIKHPFLGFNPVIGKYKSDMPKEIIGKIPFRAQIPETETESFGDEMKKED